MNKLAKLIDKILSRPWLARLLAVGLPCLSVLIAGLILLPGIRQMADIAKSEYSPTPTEQIQAAAPAETAAVTAPAPTASPTPTATPTPSPTPTPTPTPAPLVEGLSFTASSTEKDLYIKVRGADGNVLTGEKLRLDIHYPDGNCWSFDTETDGSCYLVRLEPGEYGVSMREQKGFAAVDLTRFEVKAAVEHVQIENLDEIVDFTDSTQVSSSETKTVADSSVSAEVIITPEEPAAPAPSPSVEIIETPRLDPAGNQLYTYTVTTGDNGYLLDKSTGLETQVLPIDENGDGTPEYGLELVHDETGATADYYVSVMLYNADNTPIWPYSIEATPIVDTTEQSVGFAPAVSMIGWQTIDGQQYYFDRNGSRVTGLKDIDGKLYYFNDYGVKASSVGVDVSFYNETIDWYKVKEHGVDFAIIRVGGRMWRDGSLYDDVCFEQNIRGAKNAGLQVGVYFYSTAIDELEAVQEASMVLDRLGGTSLDFPVFFDTEFSGIYPEARSDNLTKSERTAIIRAFCDTIQSGGYRPGVYSGQSFFKNQLDYSALSGYPIWLASYTSNNRLPDFSNHYDIWQFTDRGSVKGIPTAVDMNVIF